ncbi:MAG TPA: hypothetical protein VEZ44_05735 [bacterium]|nr:hypothetical protein [bacterium]
MERTTRRRFLASWTTLAASAVAGWHDAPEAAAQAPLVNIRTGMFGELMEAWYAGPQGIVRARVTRDTAGVASRARVEVLRGDAFVLTVVASTPMRAVPQTLGAAMLAVRGGATTYRLRWDASSIGVTAQEFPSNGSALVEVQSGARVWHGGFDLETWSMRGPWEGPGLDSVLPPTVTDPAAPFAAVFESIIVRSEALSGGAFAPVPGQFPVVQAGTARASCSAACWGAAGGAAAAACPTAPGIACILATSACGIAASVCNGVCRA